MNNEFYCPGFHTRCVVDSQVPIPGEEIIAIFEQVKCPRL